MSYKGQILLMCSVVFLLFGCSNGSDVGDVIDDSAKDVNRVVNNDVNNHTKEISMANNILGFSTLTLLNQQSEENIFISPTSLYTALLLAYNGSDGETRSEFMDVLQVEDWTEEEINNAMYDLLARLNMDTDDIEVRSANSLWLADHYTFQQDYEKTMEKYFNAQMETIDKTADTSVRKINKWVQEKTNNKIDDIIQAPLSANFVALLVNVLYFNGKWQYEFDESLTEEATFYTIDNEVEVPFMSLEEKVAYVETDDMQAVQLPYGKGEMVMHVYVPKEDKDMADFVQHTLPEEWGSWQSAFQLENVALTLPKFTFEYGIVLNDVLKELGIEQAFLDEADFSKMVKESSSLTISEVKQKTHVDVNEAGTEAAAATSVLMEESAIIMDDPLEMNVNRPFVFAIIDTKTDAILFLGKMNDPSY